jgi:hypothetical protein
MISPVASLVLAIHFKNFSLQIIVPIEVRSMTENTCWKSSQEGLEPYKNNFD